MTLFIIAILFTLGVSAWCSVMEALILSTTTAEVEDLKQAHRRRGLILETLKEEIEETISAILTLNTIANTLGAVIVGGLATQLFGQTWLGVVSGLMTFGILIFSEIIPKNVGVAYRTKLQKHIVIPLYAMRRVMRPLTWLCNSLVRRILPGTPLGSSSEREIVLLAEKGAREGSLSKDEFKLIQNSLTLADMRVNRIMTPRKVVMALDETLTARKVLQQFRTIPFGRMPVYRNDIDDITGIVRRRDILHAIAVGESEKSLAEMKDQVLFVPELGTAAKALESLLAAHQQMAVVLDEFGMVAGVITIEDITEHIIGKEIYEKDDPAVDMRELALGQRSGLPPKP